MKAVLQRVKQASVVVDYNRVSEIKNGLLILIGICKEDTEEEIAKMAQKIAKIRIFPDNEDKMNLSVKDIGGEILVVSQFTLCAKNKKGTRPNFMNAAPPDRAEKYINHLCKLIKLEGIPVKIGVFGAMMDVNLTNDGPVTIILNM